MKVSYTCPGGSQMCCNVCLHLLLSKPSWHTKVHQPAEPELPYRPQWTTHGADAHAWSQLMWMSERGMGKAGGSCSKAGEGGQRMGLWAGGRRTKGSYSGSQLCPWVARSSLWLLLSTWIYAISRGGWSKPSSRAAQNYLRRFCSDWICATIFPLHPGSLAAATNVHWISTGKPTCLF